jgi:hypothetical protein
LANPAGAQTIVVLPAIASRTLIIANFLVRALGGSMAAKLLANDN